MKKHYTFFIAILAAISVCAQEQTASNDQGTVTYEQTVKLEIKLDGEASQYANMLPTERKTKKILTFNPDASLYQILKTDEDETKQMEQGGARVMIKMNEPDNQTYTDLKENSQIEQREFMTRMFLIDGTVENKWKFTGNQKMILDYPCQEAELEGAENKTVVWFTPAIPVPAGPANYIGLPGMVLAVDVNDGKNVTLATSVDFSPVDIALLEKPSKGKKISREEFDKIVDEKMKEMGAESGGQGHIMIRIKQ